MKMMMMKKKHIIEIIFLISFFLFFFQIKNTLSSSNDDVCSFSRTKIYSLDSLLNCFKTRPLNKENAEHDLHIVEYLNSIYVYRDTIKNTDVFLPKDFSPKMYKHATDSLPVDYNIKVDFFKVLREKIYPKLNSGNYEYEYQFYNDIAELVGSKRDAHSNFFAPKCYNFLLYLPFTIQTNLEQNEQDKTVQIIKLKTLERFSEHPEFSGDDIRPYNNWIINQINNEDAIEYLIKTIHNSAFCPNYMDDGVCFNKLLDPSLPINIKTLKAFPQNSNGIDTFWNLKLVNPENRREFVTKRVTWSAYPLIDFKDTAHFNQTCLNPNSLSENSLPENINKNINKNKKFSPFNQKFDAEEEKRNDIETLINGFGLNENEKLKFYSNQKIHKIILQKSGLWKKDEKFFSIFENNNNNNHKRNNNNEFIKPKIKKTISKNDFNLLHISKNEFEKLKTNSINSNQFIQFIQNKKYNLNKNKKRSNGNGNGDDDYKLFLTASTIHWSVSVITKNDQPTDTLFFSLGTFSLELNDLYQIRGAIYSAFSYFNLKKLIIDLRENGGGIIQSGYSLGKMLSPQLYSKVILPTQTDLIKPPSPWLENFNDDNNNIKRFDNEQYKRFEKINNIFSSDLSSESGFELFNLDGEFFKYNDYFNIRNKTVKRNQYSSYSDYVGMGDEYKIIHKNPPYVFNPSNLIILTSGDCGSTCGMFLKFLQLSKNSKVVSIGGLYKRKIENNEGFTDLNNIVVGSFKGASVLDLDSFKMIINDIRMKKPDLNIPTNKELTFKASLFFRYTWLELYPWNEWSVYDFKKALEGKDPKIPLEWTKKISDYHIWDWGVTRKQDLPYKKILDLFKTCAYPWEHKPIKFDSKKCGGDNKKIDNAVYGEKCAINGQFIDNSCEVFTCKIGYYLNKEKNKCIEKFKYDGIQPYPWYNKGGDKPKPEPSFFDRNLIYYIIGVSVETILFLIIIFVLVAIIIGLSVLSIYLVIKIKKDKGKDKNMNIQSEFDNVEKDFERKKLINHV